MHLSVSNECPCDREYLQVCMLIYTVLVPCTGINTEHLLVIDYTILDVLVVHTQTLYYTCNSILLLTKQNAQAFM